MHNYIYGKCRVWISDDNHEGLLALQLPKRWVQALVSSWFTSFGFLTCCLIFPIDSHCCWKTCQLVANLRFKLGISVWTRFFHWVIPRQIKHAIYLNLSDFLEILYASCSSREMMACEILDLLAPRFKSYDPSKFGGSGHFRVDRGLFEWL